VLVCARSCSVTQSQRRQGGRRQGGVDGDGNNNFNGTPYKEGLRDSVKKGERGKNFERFGGFEKPQGINERALISRGVGGAPSQQGG